MTYEAQIRELSGEEIDAVSGGVVAVAALIIAAGAATIAVIETVAQRPAVSDAAWKVSDTLRDRNRRR